MRAANSDKHITIIRAATVLVPAGLLLLYEYIRMGSISNLTADGRLYLSVADNYLKTGRFIQTARWFPGLVVPPGLPLFLLVFRALGFNETMISGLQALLFGGSCLLLEESEKQLFGRYGLSPLVYLLGYMRCRLLLGNIMVEHYYLFLICLILWQVFCVHTQRKLLWLNLTGLALLLTRPAMAPVYLAILAVTLVDSWRKRRMLFVIAMLLLPTVVLSANLLVNYRETGEWILLESYSGTDLYVTACAGAPVTVEDGLHYSDETRDMIFNDTELSMAEKSKQLGSMAKSFIREHPGEYLLKMLLRFHELFLKSYRYFTLLPVLGAALLIRHQESQCGRRLQTSLLGMNILLAVITAFGIPEIRYTAVIWPLASLHFAALPHWVIGNLLKKSGGYNG